jgi:general stress protein YciG
METREWLGGKSVPRGRLLLMSARRGSKDSTSAETDTPARVRQALAWIGRKGGKARSAALTPEQRQEIARQGGLASQRAAKRRRRQKGSSK